MSTFAEDIEKEAGDAPIAAAVIGDMGWSGYHDDERQASALSRKGELLPWHVARQLLDYEYDDGFGAPDCNAVYAYGLPLRSFSSFSTTDRRASGQYHVIPWPRSLTCLADDRFPTRVESEMSALDDAAEMAKAIRDEIVTWPGVESGSRQSGTPEHSVIDVWTDDGRSFAITVEVASR